MIILKSKEKQFEEEDQYNEIVKKLNFANEKIKEKEVKLLEMDEKLKKEKNKSLKMKDEHIEIGIEIEKYNHK